jgi:prepilin-type N-terminal cleavage/methylation domain-containing protein
MRIIKKISLCLNGRKNDPLPKGKGFSLIEVLIGIAIVAIALLGLAQLFTYGVLTNSRAERMSNATFLAQQQIDSHRNLTSDELNALASNPLDEQVDVNYDGTIDFRRITEIQSNGASWEMRVLVFSAEQLNTDATLLTQNPQEYDVKANMSTLISR